MASGVVIDWPVRSRAIDAPASADTAKLTLFRQGESDAAETLVVTRPEGAEESRRSYAFSQSYPAGGYVLDVEFHSGASPSYPVVGHTNIGVVLDSRGRFLGGDGKPLQDILLFGKVAGVTVDAGQEAIDGGTSDLAVLVTTGSGIFAVAPGAISFRVVGGTALRANADGSVTGRAEGQATVVARVDGIESKPETVDVLGKPLRLRTVPVPANALVSDASREKVWAAVPGGTDGRVVEIDPATGVAERSIRVGDNPTALALSADAKTLLVGLRGESSIRPVDLDAGIAGVAFPVGNDLGGYPPFALQLSTPPTGGGTVAASVLYEGLSGGSSLAIFDGGVPRPSTPASRGEFSVWTSATRIVASEAGTPLRLYGLTVGPEGPAFETYAEDGAGVYGLGLAYAGGRLFGIDRTVRDATTLERIGTFETVVNFVPGLQQVIGPAVDANAKLAYYIENDDRGALLAVYRTDSLRRVSKRRIAGFPPKSADVLPPLAQVYRWGPKGLALPSSRGVLLIDDVPVE